MSIRSADNLYELAATWTSQSVTAEHELVESYSTGIRRLLRGLDDEPDDGFWANLRRPLRGLGWRLSTVPLPFNSAAIGVPAAAEALIPRLRRCAAIAPERGPQADALITILGALGGCADNPLGELVEQSLDGASDPVILLTDGHRAASVTGAFPDVRVMTVTELMRGRAGDVVAVGSSLWFPLRIQQAPRAQNLTFLRYAWISDHAQELGLLGESAAPLRAALAVGLVRPIRGEAVPLPAEEIVPVVPWNAISRKARENATRHSGEPVDARLFLLASQQGVYLEAGEKERITVADVDAQIVVTFDRIRRLTPGKFVVLRTSGDGDYLEPYADKLLGKRAGHLRGIQRGLQEKLHAHVEHLGLSSTVQALRERGSLRANEANVRRWSEPGHIVTQDFADFAAICDLVGEENAEGYFAAMKEVRSTHIKAGQEVRKLLMEELRNGDLTPLLREGWGDYKVADIDGEGTLRVARITGIGDEVVPVPRRSLHKLFDIGDDLWLG